MKIQKPHFYAIFTLIIWSFAASITKMVFNYNPFSCMNLCIFFSSVTFFFIALKEYGGVNEIFARIKKFKFYHYFFASFGYFIYHVFYIKTYQAFNNTMSLNTIMNYTWPLFTFIFIRLAIQKEKFSQQSFIELFGMILSFFGIIYLATQGELSFNNINIKGILFGLGLGISYGVFSAFTYKIKPSDITAFLLLSSVIGFIGFSMYNYNFESFYLNDFNLESIFWVAILGILVDGLGYYYWGHAKSLANKLNVNIAPITSIVFFLPVFSLIILALIFKETTTQYLWFWISFMLVFIGSVIASNSKFLLTQLNSISPNRKIK